MSTTSDSYAVAIPLSPLVLASAFGVIATITMFSLHPVLCAISLVGALSCSFALRGVDATILSVRWQLPMIVLISLANPLFVASGSTLVMQVGPMAIYLESLVFGLVAGGIMVAALLWLECLAQTLSFSTLQALLGRHLPITALAITMTTRLATLMRERYRVVSEAQAANTASHAPRPRTPLHAALMHSGVLLGWALGDSLETADAMRARGWDAHVRRTGHWVAPVRTHDAIVLVGLAQIALVSALLAGVACAQWHFYPTMPRLLFWWGYLPFVALCASPAAAIALWRLRWHGAERRRKVVSDDGLRDAANSKEEAFFWERGGGGSLVSHGSGR